MATITTIITKKHLRYLSAAVAVLTLGLCAGPRAAEAQNRDKWAVSDDSGISTRSTPATNAPPEWGPGAYARAFEAGFGWSRYWLYWDNLNKTQGVAPDFTSSDYEINGILSSGMQVYGDIMWAPQWAVQSTPGYVAWNCGTSEFLPKNPGCGNVHPDTASFTAFVQQAIAHYGNQIRYWGFWNEPNYLVFWHSLYDPAHQDDAANYNQNLQNLVDDILIPGYVAAKQQNPKVQIVGPDIDDPVGLQIILQRDDQYYQQTGNHFIDVISFHQYPKDGDAAQEWALLDRYNAPGGPLQTYRAGRPVWVTETNATPATAAALYTGFEQRGWIDRVFYHGYKAGYCNDPAEASICGWGWAIAARANRTPTDPYLVDVADFPLAPFYQAQSVIAPRLFTTQVPASFVSASPGYEVATQFSSSVNGTVKALRFYRAPGETGSNTLHLWTDSGTPLASATYTGSGSGWQEVAIGGGVAVTAGTRYRVSVNTNTQESKTNCGLGTAITNGPLTAYQGYWGQPMGSLPVNASCSNFFTDVVLEPGTEIFTSQTPASFVSAVPGYEVGTRFSSSVNGTLKALRFYRAPGDTEDNILRLWADSGTLLASGRFVDNGSGASGWKEVAIDATPITAGAFYRVSVSTKTMQSKTNCGLSTPITNGPLTASQGYWGATLGVMPSTASCSNYFVDALLSW